MLQTNEKDQRKCFNTTHKQWNEKSCCMVAEKKQTQQLVHWFLCLFCSKLQFSADFSACQNQGKNHTGMKCGTRRPLRRLPFSFSFAAQCKNWKWSFNQKNSCAKEIKALTFASGGWAVCCLSSLKVSLFCLFHIGETLKSWLMKLERRRHPLTWHLQRNQCLHRHKLITTSWVEPAVVLVLSRLRLPVKSVFRNIASLKNIQYTFYLQQYQWGERAAAGKPFDRSRQVVVSRLLSPTKPGPCKSPPDAKMDCSPSWSSLNL